MDRHEPFPSVIDKAICVFGGITALAQAAGVSRPAVYSWIELGYIPKRAKAIMLSEKLAKKGCVISASRLMALDERPAEPIRRARVSA